MPTLSELKQKKDSGFVDNPESLKTISRDQLSKIAPPKEDSGAKEILDQELGYIDKLLQSEMENVNKKEEQYYQEKEEELQDVIFDAPVEDIDMGIISGEAADKELAEAFNNAVTSVKEDPSIKAGVEAVSNVGNTEVENEDMDDLLNELDNDDEFDFDDDEDDIDISEDDEDEDDDEDEEQEEEQRQMLKDMQHQISDAIKPFNNAIDLKSFKIATKPKSAQKILEETTTGPTAEWVLLDSKQPFTCSALGAVEIENLDPNRTNSQNGRITALKQMYGTLFSHYMSPNKPKSLEEWVKTISYSDQDNLLFGYYKATFGLSNLITYACEKCKTVKVKDVPIDKCVKYADEETKKEVENILKYGDSTHKGKIISELVQVSDKLAVSIRNPSIYTIVFEFGVLDPDFTNKFANVLGTVGYIEDIYEIDTVNGTLIPITVKEDKKNMTKTVKRKIRAKVQILRTLTPDQYNILTGKIAEIAKNADRITYCQPEYKCEKCGNEIAETVMTAQEMLFIRHQLALIQTLSVE